MSDPKYLLNGFLIPSKIFPSFVIPVFFRKGEYFVQVSEPSESPRLIQLEKRAYARIIHLSRVQRKITPGGPVIYGFAFRETEAIFQTKDLLSNMLKTRLAEIYPHPFVYKDVLEFLGDIEGSRKAVYRLGNILARTEELQPKASQFVRIELKDMGVSTERGKEKSLEDLPLKYMDDEGYINYWNIYHEIDNLIHLYHNVYIRYKLVRSLIGTSPKVRNTLLSLGFPHRRVGRFSTEITVNKSNVQSLKRLRTYIIITHIRIFSETPFEIRARKPVEIQKRYLKRDWKKVVKGKQYQDYQCSFINTGTLH